MLKVENLERSFAAPATAEASSSSTWICISAARVSRVATAMR